MILTSAVDIFSVSSLVFLDFLGSLNQTAEPTAESTSSVVTLSTLHINRWQQNNYDLDFAKSFDITLISYLSLASVLSNMMGTQGVMNKLWESNVKCNLIEQPTSSEDRQRHSCPGPQQCCRSGNRNRSRRNSLDREGSNTFAVVNCEKCLTCSHIIAAAESSMVPFLRHFLFCPLLWGSVDTDISLA